MDNRLSEIICEAIQTDECVHCCNHPYCYSIKTIVEKLKQNNVIITPYSVGDTVYFVSGKSVKPARVEEIIYNGCDFSLGLVTENNVYFDLPADKVFATNELYEQYVGEKQ